MGYYDFGNTSIVTVATVIFFPALVGLTICAVLDIIH